jgi:hypothetical protein
LNKIHYITDHINPWWGILHRSLNYQNEPFNNNKDIIKWRDIGFTHSKFTGDMYDMRNTEPAWMKLNLLQDVFQFSHLSWSFYRMGPGVILPQHIDTFVKFKSLYNTKNKTIVRGLVMLEDWQQGHYLDMNGFANTSWKAGDYYIWEEDCPHTAANIGMNNRYTLQLTGLIDGRL